MNFRQAKKIQDRLLKRPCPAYRQPTIQKADAVWMRHTTYNNRMSRITFRESDRILSQIFPDYQPHAYPGRKGDSDLIS